MNSVVRNNKTVNFHILKINKKLFVIIFLSFLFLSCWEDCLLKLKLLHVFVTLRNKIFFLLPWLPSFEVGLFFWCAEPLKDVFSSPFLMTLLKSLCGTKIKMLGIYIYIFILVSIFFFKDFIFKKTSFEKLQYLKQEQ